MSRRALSNLNTPPETEPTVIDRLLSKAIDGVGFGAAKTIAETVAGSALGAFVMWSGGFEWEPLLFGGASFALGAFISTMVDYRIGVARKRVERWSWRPSNSLAILPERCFVNGAGTLTIEVVVRNFSPFPWAIHGGLLDSVRLGGYPLPIPLNLSDVASSVTVPPNADIVLSFQGGPIRCFNDFADWLYVAVGERQGTSIEKRTLGGAIYVHSPFQDEYTVPVMPFQCVLSTQNWKESNR